MTKEQFSFGPKGYRKSVFINYEPDPPLRVEAISFFKSLEFGLVQASPLPEECYDMDEDEAQRYVDNLILKKNWGMLTILSKDPVENQDLVRLKYLPEIKMLRVLSDKIGDEGIKYLKYLTSLEVLEIYSSKVSDRCLDYLTSIDSLQRLDMQGARGVSATAFKAVAGRLPMLRASLAPKGS